MKKDLIDRIVEDVLSCTETTRHGDDKNYVLFYIFNGVRTSKKPIYYSMVGEYIHDIFGVYQFQEEHKVYDEVERRLTNIV